MEPNPIPQQPIQSSPAVQTPPPSPAAPVKPKNRLLISLVIVIILLSLGAAGFFAYQNIQLKKQISQIAPIPSPAVVPGETGTQDGTANWKTYTNDLMRYSFSYPSTWKIEEAGADYGVNKAIRDENNNLIFFLISTGNTDHLNLTNSYKAKSCFEQTCDPFINTDEKIIDNRIIQVENQNVLTVTTNIQNETKKYYFYLNDNTISVFQVLTSNQKLLTTIDQILSTFRFTSTNTQQTGIFSSVGQSCGGLAGLAGDAQCAPGLTCQHKNPNDPNDIGTCVK